MKGPDRRLKVIHTYAALTQLLRPFDKYQLGVSKGVNLYLKASCRSPWDDSQRPHARWRWHLAACQPAAQSARYPDRGLAQGWCLCREVGGRQSSGEEEEEEQKAGAQGGVKDGGGVPGYFLRLSKDCQAWLRHGCSSSCITTRTQSAAWSTPPQLKGCFSVCLRLTLNLC